jgi:hypothetical protein
MNDDVEGMWKEAVVPYFEELSDVTCSKRGKAQNMATRMHT